jgi:hypothetical protein
VTYWILLVSQIGFNLRLMWSLRPLGFAKEAPQLQI